MRDGGDEPIFGPLFLALSNIPFLAVDNLHQLLDLIRGLVQFRFQPSPNPLKLCLLRLEFLCQFPNLLFLSTQLCFQVSPDLSILLLSFEFLAQPLGFLPFLS